MVFCGLYPVDGDEFADLREALEKLRLNDASFTYEPETSGALGFGFRCGFLGLLHMEIVRERLEREFDLSLIATAPSVEYLRAHDRRARWSRSTTRPSMPPPTEIDAHRGAVPHRHDPHAHRLHGHAHGAVPDRGGARCRSSSTCRPSGSSCVYRLPLAEVVIDFFDQMKSRTQGYASLDYEPAGYARARTW